MNNLLKIFIVLFWTFTNAAHLNASDNTEAIKLFREANQLLKEANFKEAAQKFGDITYQYPYYKQASKSQIMEIYAYYMDKDYDNAIPTIENFVKSYPVSKYLPYIFYMKALCYFQQIDVSERDQSVSEEAHMALSELLNRFPNSKYAADARRKLQFVDERLAGQKMIIGKYYMNDGNILAAINRFKEVEQEYSHTIYGKEALYRLSECYNFLGLQAEFKKYQSILIKKYGSNVL